MKKNILKLICVVVVIVIVGVMCVGCGKEKYDFADDTIIIKLTQEAFDSGKVYTVEDFPEVEVTEIRSFDGLNLFVLTLKNPSHKNVLAAVKLLEKRPDVERANPDYILTGGV